MVFAGRKTLSRAKLHEVTLGRDVDAATRFRGTGEVRNVADRQAKVDVTGTGIERVEHSTVEVDDPGRPPGDDGRTGIEAGTAPSPLEPAAAQSQGANPVVSRHIDEPSGI